MYDQNPKKPSPPDDIDDYLSRYTRKRVREEAQKQGVDPDLAERQFGQESAYKPDVIKGQRRSSAGAIGAGQLMPGTAKDLGVDPYHIDENISGSVRYMKQQLDAFGGDSAKAAAAYNWGPGNVKKYGLSNAPAETQNYVKNVAGQQKDDVDEFLSRWKEPSAPRVSPFDETEDQAKARRAGMTRTQRKQDQRQTIGAMQNELVESSRIMQQPTPPSGKATAGVFGQSRKGQAELKKAFKVDPSTGIQVFEDAGINRVNQRAAMPATPESIKRRKAVEAERARFQQRSLLGRAAETAATQFALNSPEWLTPEAQQDINTRALALGLEPAKRDEWIYKPGTQLARSAARTAASGIQGTAELANLFGRLSPGEAQALLDAADTALGAPKGYSAQKAKELLAAARELPGKAEQVTPLADPTDKSWLGAKIPQAFGSAAVFGPLGQAGQALRIPGAVVSGMTGAAIGAGQQNEAARKAGVSQERQDLATLLGALSGSTEALGFERLMGGAGAIPAPVKEIAKDMAQEYGQQYLDDINAKYVGGYDPNASMNPLSRNKLEAAALGGIVSGTMSAPSVIANRAANAQNIQQIQAERAPMPGIVPSVPAGTQTQVTRITPEAARAANQPVAPSVTPDIANAPTEPLTEPIATNQIPSEAIPAPSQPNAPLFPAAQQAEQDISQLQGFDKLAALEARRSGTAKTTPEQAMSAEFERLNALAESPDEADRKEAAKGFNRLLAKIRGSQQYAAETRGGVTETPYRNARQVIEQRLQGLAKPKPQKAATPAVASQSAQLPDLLAQAEGFKQDAVAAEQAGNFEAAAIAYQSARDILRTANTRHGKTMAAPDLAALRQDINLQHGAFQNAQKQARDLQRQANKPTAGLPQPRRQAAQQPPPLMQSGAIVNPEGGIPAQAPKMTFTEELQRGIDQSDAARAKRKPQKRLLSRIAELGGIDKRYAGELRDVKDARRIGVIRDRAQMSPDILARQLQSEGYNVDPDDLNTLWEAARRDISDERGFRPADSAALDRRLAEEEAAYYEKQSQAVLPASQSFTWIDNKSHKRRNEDGDLVDVPFKKGEGDWRVKDDLGGEAYGKIVGGVASIIGMESVPPSKRYTDEAPSLKRRGFFRSLIKTLQANGARSIEINMQSADTQAAIQRLLQTGDIVNPREMRGSSLNEHPTLFDIPQEQQASRPQSQQLRQDTGGLDQAELDSAEDITPEEEGHIVSALKKLGTDNPVVISQMFRDADKRHKISATAEEKAASRQAWSRVSRLTPAEHDALAKILPERVFAPVKEDYAGEGTYSRAVSDFAADETLGAQGEANFEEVMNFFDEMAQTDTEITDAGIAAIRQQLANNEWAKKAAGMFAKDIPILTIIAEKQSGEAVRWMQLYDKIHSGEQLSETERNTFTQLGRQLGLSAKYLKSTAAQNNRQTGSPQKKDQTDTRVTESRESGERAKPAETGRVIQHSQFGEVRESADQSGVAKGKLRVVDSEGGEHVIQNPRTSGNRSAAFAKDTKPAESPAKPAEGKPASDVDALLAAGTITPEQAAKMRRKPKISERREAPGAMPERYTGRQLFENARVQFRPARNRPATLVANDWGGAMMNRLLSERYGESTTDANFTIAADDMQELRDYLAETKDSGIYDEAQTANMDALLSQMDAAIKDAKANNQDVAFVTRKAGEPISQTKIKVRHETAHVSQSRVTPDMFALTERDWLGKQPEAAAVRAELERRGYPPETHAHESAVFVASGDFDAFGMNLDQATKFLSNYFKAVVQKHGRRALDRFGAIDPRLQPTLERARNEKTEAGQAANERRSVSYSPGTRRTGTAGAEVSRSNAGVLAGRREESAGVPGISERKEAGFSFGRLENEPEGQIAAAGLGALQNLAGKIKKTKTPDAVPADYDVWDFYDQVMKQIMPGKDKQGNPKPPKTKINNEQADAIANGLLEMVEAADKQDFVGIFNAREKVRQAMLPAAKRDVKWYDHMQSRLSNLNFRGIYERIAGTDGKAVSEILRQAQVDIANGEVTRAEAVKNLRKELRPYIRQFQIAGKPGLARWIENHIDAVTDPDQSFKGLAGFMKGGQFYAKLAYNPRSAMINMFQPMQTLWPHLSTREWLAIQKRATSRKEWQRIGEIAARESGGSVEGLARPDVSVSTWRQAVKTGFFGYASEYNRVVGHLAGEMMADRQGITGREKARMAADWAKKVEFDNSQWDIPPLFSGPIAGVVGQFKPFMVKNLERLYADWKSSPYSHQKGKDYKYINPSGNLARRSKMIVGQVALGGIRSAIPGLKHIGGVLILGGLAKAFGKFMDDDDAEKMAEAVYFGLPALVEQDLSGSVTVFDEPFGKTAEEKMVNFFGGPTLSLAAKAWNTYGKVTDAKDTDKSTAAEKRKRALLSLGKAVSPYVKTGQAIAAAAKGETPKMWMGKEVPMTKKEAIGYGLMGTPLRQSKYWEHEEAPDWQKEVMPDRFTQSASTKTEFLNKFGQMSEQEIKRKPGEPDAVYQKRVERVSGWMNSYGEKLVNHPLYNLLTAEQKQKAIENLRDRVGKQMNLVRPNERTLEPQEVIKAVRKAATRKPRREQEKMWEAEN